MVKVIAKKINRRLKRISQIVRSPLAELSTYRENLASIHSTIQEIDSLKNTKAPSGEFACIIFSKDRPIQLFALLRSLKKYSKGISTIRVIYNSENSEFEESYQEVFSYFENEYFLAVDDKSGFKKTLKDTVGSLTEEKMMFLVDDIVFTRKFDLNVFEKVNLRENVISLRLGERIKFCYMQDSIQELPRDFKVKKELTSWTWENGNLDWKYPLSVDGHLFAVDEMSLMINGIEFKAPNTFEEKLQKFNKVYLKRKGISFKNPVLFNNPCNMVQSEITDNNSGELNPKDLLRKWQEGYEIDLEAFEDYQNRGVHEERPLTFIKRTI